jgi:hypothetical protein
MVGPIKMKNEERGKSWSIGACGFGVEFGVLCIDLTPAENRPLFKALEDAICKAISEMGLPEFRKTSFFASNQKENNDGN